MRRLFAPARAAFASVFASVLASAARARAAAMLSAIGLALAAVVVAVVVGTSLAGCEEEPTGPALGVDEIPLRVDLRCPGDPQCPAGADATLLAGTAQRDITPLVEPFVDKNGNNLRDPDEPFTDLDKDGRFDPVWLAGRDNGTLAYGVHDPIWARCLALGQAGTTLVLCSLDVIGYFVDEQRQVRANLDPALGVDLLLVAATHNHQAPDTIGMWGLNVTTSGYDDDWMRRVRIALTEAAAEAVRGMRPAKMSIASIAAEQGPARDMIPFVSDTRDPVVIDNRMHVLHFAGAADGKPIVTLIDWSAHPDSLGSNRHYISSDFVHSLRETVEAGTGAPVVYISGSVGGQIGPGRVQPIDDDGKVVPNTHDFRFIDVWGRSLGRLALRAFDARKEVAAPKLAFRRTSFAAHVENLAYHTGFLLNLFRRSIYGYDPKKPLLRTAEFDNAPLVDTEATYITLGPAAMITVPGELLPELLLGGYGGELAGTYEFIDTKAPNAPDPTRAPRPPYLFDLMDGAPEHRMVLGLTGDFLGYIVPRYNFVLDETAPYLEDAPGDHYEETNSIGPRAEPEIVGTLRQLVLAR